MENPTVQSIFPDLAKCAGLDFSPFFPKACAPPKPRAGKEQTQSCWIHNELTGSLLEVRSNQMFGSTWPARCLRSPSPWHNEGKAQTAGVPAGRGCVLAFFGQVQQLHLLLPLLRERQVVPVLCIVFQQREIWGRLGASGETFFSETFSVVWLYRALLLGTAEERQARAASIGRIRRR